MWNPVPKFPGILALFGLLFVLSEPRVYASNNCAGVQCSPNPGSCTANYDAGGCCPVWQCSDGRGGITVMQGMSRTGNNGNSYQSSTSYTSRNGGGGGGSYASSSSYGSGPGYGGGYTGTFHSGNGYGGGYSGVSTRFGSNNLGPGYASSGASATSYSSGAAPAGGFTPFSNPADFFNFFRANFPPWFPGPHYHY